MRLDAYYNSRWGELEAFNISEAFKSQVAIKDSLLSSHESKYLLLLKRAKVDMEWGKHEQVLLQDYLGKRRALTGVAAETSSAPVVSTPTKADDRWQHPEKQKSLIHTAPVLSPKSGAAAATASGSGAKAVMKIGRDALSPELEALERAYARLQQSSNQQKNSALK